MTTWTPEQLNEMLGSALTEMELAPTAQCPTFGFMQRHKVHRSFRLTDMKWHHFRYSDAQKAREADAAYGEPMLPKETPAAS